MKSSVPPFPGTDVYVWMRLGVWACAGTEVKHVMAFPVEWLRADEAVAGGNRNRVLGEKKAERKKDVGEQLLETSSSEVIFFPLNTS